MSPAKLLSSKGITPSGVAPGIGSTETTWHCTQETWVSWQMAGATGACPTVAAADPPAAFQFSYGADLDRALTALWRGVVGETAPAPAAGKRP